ncbi:hypothetical protein C1645_824321 [Glomus cerebriforme]|uniref:Uncharacterized protein n=1 Tax=Glomus cerebriforme TaxID=658196 RepID=A0A397SVU3_9GLOM|nr:hypothetical protein C1645_824321 [Glomus cerebriforme]
MDHPQNNLGGNIHESNFTGFVNGFNNSNNLLQTTALNINYNDAPCNYNKNFNGNIVPVHLSISPDHNPDYNYQQSISRDNDNILNNNVTFSPGDINYQQSMFNDTSNNNNVIISSDQNHQQYDTTNNISLYNSQQSVSSCASNDTVIIPPDQNNQQ